MRDERSRESGLSWGEIWLTVINCVVRLDRMNGVGVAIRNVKYTPSAITALD